jgi:hypothetical protein
MVANGRSSTEVMRPSGTVVVLTAEVVVSGVVAAVEEGVPLPWQAIKAVAKNVNFSLCFTVLP